MRWIIRIVGALIIALVIVAAGFFLLPGDQVTRLLASQIKAATGRNVEFEGGVRPSLYPQVGVRTGKVRIANAEWSDGGPILEAEGLNVALDLRGLLNGDLLIGDITAISPRLLLETAADGSVNWNVFEGGGVSSETATAPDVPKRRISLQNLSLTDAAIRFVDRKTGDDVALQDFDLSLTAPDLDGPSDIRMTYRRDGVPIVITAQIARTSAFLDGTQSPVRARVEAAGAVASFSGSANTAGQAEGALRASMPDTAKVFAALGFKNVVMPKGFGRSAEFDAGMAYADSTLSLNNLTAKLDSTQITGNLKIRQGGARPMVSGALRTGTLDLTQFAAGGGDGQSDAAQKGWSTERIDASALAFLDADLDLSLAGLRMGAIAAEDIALGVMVENARGVATVRRARAFGGEMSGTFVANNRNGLSVSADSKVSGVKMQRMLDDLMGYERLSGTAEGRIKVLGVGNTMHAIMRSLRGDGAVSIKDGEIFGLELAKLFLGQGAQGGSTIFDALSGSFVINQGVMQNDDLSVSLPRIGAKGAGKIDLGGQRIDYRVTPVLPKTGDGREIIFPVTIKGAWANPKIGVDLENAIKKTFEKEIEAEKKKVEAKVKKKVEEEVGKALGVTVQEGESVEDAAKRALENELKKGLGRLLNP